jgi:hypothetical protein
MNNYISFTYLLFVLLLLTTSCKKHSTATNQEQQENKIEIRKPTVLNNSLSFATRDDFNHFVNEINKIPQNELNKYMEKEFEKFTSLKQKKGILNKQKGVETQSEEILQLDIKDPNTCKYC